MRRLGLQGGLQGGHQVGLQGGHKEVLSDGLTPRSFCCVSNSIIAGTQFGAGLPHSAHARAQSDRAVRLTAGHAQNEGALHQTESQKLCY